MALDNFRTQQITWDKASRKIYEEIRVSSEDENGRKLTVQVINNGVVEDLTGFSLNLAWETRDGLSSGLDAFEATETSKGKFTLTYKTGMLQKVGALDAQLVLIGPETSKITSENFKITVFGGVGIEGAESSNELSALTTALATVNQYDARIESKADKSTTEQSLLSLNQQLAQTELKTPWVSVEQFGAVGDYDGTNGTDDTLAILNAIENVKTGGKVLFNHNKKYLVTSTITVPSYVTLEFIGDSELVYDGNNKYFVMFERSSKLVGGVFNRVDKTWGANNPISALVIKDHDQVTLLDFTILNFEVGVHLIGDDRGSCYHHISPKLFHNCRTPIKLETYNKGWVNENSFYGGRLAIDTIRRIKSNNGIEFAQGSTNAINSNKFYSPSIEGFGTPIHIEGRDNSFYGVRFEFDVSGKFITFKDTQLGGAIRNNFFGYYGLANNEKIRSISSTGEVTDGNNYNNFYGANQPITSLWGVRLDNNRNVIIKYSSSENAVIIERKDIEREFLRIGNSGVDFLNRPVFNLTLQKVTSESRPPASEGNIVFDIDLKIPIFGDGSYWINANGERV